MQLSLLFTLSVFLVRSEGADFPQGEVLVVFKLVWGLMRVVRDEYRNSCTSLFFVAMRKFCVLEYG